MPPTVQLNLPPTQVQSLSRPREGAGNLLTSLLSEAVAVTGCSEKEAALAQGYDPAYWSRIKAGEKQAHLERIGRLPEPVQREFVKRWGKQLHMDIRDSDAKTQALAELAECAVRALRVIA